MKKSALFSAMLFLSVAMFAQVPARKTKAQLGDFKPVPASKYKNPANSINELVMVGNQMFLEGKDGNYTPVATVGGGLVDRRRLSAIEYDFARRIFVNSFPGSDDIYVTNLTSPANGAYMVTPGIFNDYMHMGNLYADCLGNKSIFAHELTHIWQIKHYGYLWFIREFLENHVLGGICSKDPYPYECQYHKEMDDYNAEQQGEIVREYYLKKGCPTEMAQRTLGKPPVPPEFDHDLKITSVNTVNKSPLKVSVTVQNVGKKSNTLNGARISGFLSATQANPHVQDQDFGFKQLPVQNWSGGSTLAPDASSTKIFDFGAINQAGFKFVELRLINVNDDRDSNNKGSDLLLH